MVHHQRCEKSRGKCRYEDRGDELRFSPLGSRRHLTEQDCPKGVRPYEPRFPDSGVFCIPDLFACRKVLTRTVAFDESHKDWFHSRIVRGKSASQYTNISTEHAPIFKTGELRAAHLY